MHKKVKLKEENKILLFAHTQFTTLSLFKFSLHRSTAAADNDGSHYFNFPPPQSSLRVMNYLNCFLSLSARVFQLHRHRFN
jgi:hypothetical protein